MTLTEQLEAMPEEERSKFFRALIEVAEAGRRAAVDPKEWAQQYTDVYNGVTRQLKEQA